MCTCWASEAPTLKAPTICVARGKGALRDCKPRWEFVLCFQKRTLKGLVNWSSLLWPPECQLTVAQFPARVQVSSGQLASDAGVQAVKPQVCYLLKGSCRKHSPDHGRHGPGHQVGVVLGTITH